MRRLKDISWTDMYVLKTSFRNHKNDYVFVPTPRRLGDRKNHPVIMRSLKVFRTFQKRLGDSKISFCSLLYIFSSKDILKT